MKLRTLSLRLLGAGVLGTTLVLPLPGGQQGGDASPAAATAKSKSEPRKVDLNTADRKTLESIPAIGDLAPAIMAARPFATIDELDRLQGLNSERLEQIRGAVTVTPPATKDTHGFPLAAESGRSDRARDERKKVDLNTADVKTLEAIPVIGPDLARKIVASRPFATVDELNRVDGMNAERLEQIRAVTITSATDAANTAAKSDATAKTGTTAKSDSTAPSKESDEEKNKALEPTGRAKNPPGKTDKQ